MSLLSPVPPGSPPGSSQPWYSMEFRDEIPDPDCATYKIGESANVAEWQILQEQNGRYLFKNGTTSGYDKSVFAVRGERIAYIATGEDEHVKRTQTFESGMEKETITYEGASGYLPQISTCGVNKEERQEMEHRECGLEESHLENEKVVQNDFIESDELLKEYAKRHLMEDTALTVNFQAPVNWALKSGQKIHIYVPEGRINTDAFVWSVGWAGTPGSPVLTTVTAKVYVID